MATDRNRTRRAPRPLDPARLEELALAYVARFATSAAKLQQYLARKLRERGWDGPGPADLGAIAERFVACGYIDDEAYARAKSGGLLRRGYGPRRVAQALGESGGIGRGGPFPPAFAQLADQILPELGGASGESRDIGQRQFLEPRGVERPRCAARAVSVGYHARP